MARDEEGRGMVCGKVCKVVEFIFFFKQKTAYEMCGRDWSSDVCSSDLTALSALHITIKYRLSL